MGTPFINDKGDTALVRSFMKQDSVNNRVVGKDSTKNLQPNRDVNLSVRGQAPSVPTVKKNSK